MSNWLAIAATLALFADADVPRVYNLKQPGRPAAPVTFGEEIPLFPTNPKSDSDQSAPASAARKSATLQEESKLALIRFVSGEFAKATKSLPAGKEGFQVFAEKPLNNEQLDHVVAVHGAAIHAGDHVQITKLDFRDHTIVVDVNGGGRGKKRFLDHLQIGMGGTPMPTSTVTQENQGPPGLQPGMGSTIFLEFGKAVPDLTPDDLKKLLAPILDFSKERSASVQWADTLPKEIKAAISERRPLIGMDREMVVAAIGKPGHKVRERDSDGNDIEDWIYGTPPAKTIFVRFTGERVSSIRQFPN
ncbi:MAG: hypothetical protein JSS69_17070 [Acidobacteria bacterium]|nr:hypothetical protein [Acidobacteriota bacterium]MBS1867628.1 hypothetical protein [Acidobacteriota bacterium]